MRRYLVLSLFLHLIVLGIFLYRKVETVQSISIGETPNIENATNSLGNPESLKVTTAQKISSPNLITKNESSEAPILSDTPDSSSLKNSTTPFEDGEVTLKPQVKKQIKISYPQQAKDARIDGAVKLSVVINPLGYVDEVKVLDGPGYGLNEAAETALKQFVFSPAEIKGEKVPVRIVYIYRFKLDHQ